MNQKACEAEVYCNDKLVWTGFSGQVATIEMETERADISILIKQAYTGHPFPFFKDFYIKGSISTGKKYEIKNARVSLIFGDPTKSDWVLSEVDIIDSDL